MRTLVAIFVVLVAAAVVSAAPEDGGAAGGRRVKRDACDSSAWEWLNEAACSTKCRLDGYKEAKCVLGKCLCYSLPSLQR